MIKTFTGKDVDVFNFNVEDYNPKDVSHALSRTCRYNGHSSSFFSVATHSMNVVRVAELMKANPPTCLYALLHDAAEIYIGDMPGPIKSKMPEFKKLDKKITDTIIEYYGKLFNFPNWHEYIDFDLINKIDKSMLLPEMGHLFKDSVIEFDLGPILSVPTSKIVLSESSMTDTTLNFAAWHNNYVDATSAFLVDKQAKEDLLF